MQSISLRPRASFGQLPDALRPALEPVINEIERRVRQEATVGARAAVMPVVLFAGGAALVALLAAWVAVSR